MHNAGITRDKLLANTDADRWASVLDVNLGSILRMNEAFLGPDGLRDGGHVVLVSSIAGIAGNRGQTNYAASKAGVIGLVDALRDRRGAAPTRHHGQRGGARVHRDRDDRHGSRFATRELGRRLNSLSQGGLPVDVAETIAYFASDAQSGGDRQRRARLRPEPARGLRWRSRPCSGMPSTAPLLVRAALTATRPARGRRARPHPASSRTCASTATRLAAYQRL